MPKIRVDIRKDVKFYSSSSSSIADRLSPSLHPKSLSPKPPFLPFNCSINATRHYKVDTPAGSPRHVLSLIITRMREKKSNILEYSVKVQTSENTITSQLQDRIANREIGVFTARVLRRERWSPRHRTLCGRLSALLEGRVAFPKLMEEVILLWERAELCQHVFICSGQQYYISYL